jgi:CheY-like chemotaxis protein
MADQSPALDTILVVDDDDSIRWLVTEILEDVGYCVVSAKNGREALEFLRDTQELPSLILLDLMMPIMDGARFRSAQLGDSVLCQIPVVVLSAGKNSIQAKALQAASFIPKPFDVNQLVEVVLKHCPHKPVHNVELA